MTAHLSRLPGDVEELLALGGGLLTVGSAQAAGVTRPRLQRLVRADLLVQLAYGTYAGREDYENASPWQAFALRSRAFAAVCGPEAHAAGWSAVAVRELPTVGRPPEKPVVVVPPGSRADGNYAFGDIRAVALPPEHRTVVDGCPTLTDARLVVDLTRTEDREQGLVLADAVLAAGTMMDDLRDVLEMQRRWPGVAEAS
ncbi:type IV toxin-antitoxin system AbiEi family antitoxin domain-containing protein [Phytoactinopolyspora halotolerans]|uniref:Type IV toxin-antitoxin system AbiEi family antitoxin domain-containing protein n=1 Tax=Phytoactinopolyspora halotolerans TaxID=1981512 RepID=A0A6L9S5Y8_9ACTN|nr:type IV toxin-antitoxin system AbiEi family antitoxin domain-containing protein [Phytoactinopolyspora halotolerans]NED99921.1 hypothetical protein [Phytoactinopolyspora halotolerans]